jgi:DNA-binding MarR family transcriptional regulator
VRRLRSRLDLDSGYLSRLLRSLEAAQLITVHPNRDDKRVRTVQLTPAGLAERALLDRRSDELSTRPIATPSSASAHTSSSSAGASKQGSTPR